MLNIIAMTWKKNFFTGLLALSSLEGQCVVHGSKTKRPNIVVIMSDDQDARLNSLDAQSYISNTFMKEGLSLANHFATVGQCCPSRTSWLRGQAAHNTNITHVRAPGGGYDKFTQSGQDLNYLPHWLGAAGYTTEYVGKFMNGYNLATYTDQPKGWDHTDILVSPYIYEFNNVVMSQNDQRPVFYNGFHQTDVIRAKSLGRLQALVDAGDPFFIQIAPTAPHTQPDGPTVPCERHMYRFNNVTAPRIPNFNPSQKYQSQKPSWVGKMPSLTQEEIDFIDWQHRSRFQGLAGVDEIVQDVVNFLRDADELDNTFVIYTSDNGFHMGNHRRIGGKGLPYIEDVNIPMIIRGPGIPAGVTSKIPSTHIDMAPTFLELAGLSQNHELYPPFLDGRSLVHDWTKPKHKLQPGSSKEILNIEFWGTIDNAGGPDFKNTSPQYSYKTLRIVGEESAWLFSRWCERNATELYDTIRDPYELTNLALNPTKDHQRLISRLNGLLLVTKSCHQESCRSPWKVLQEAAKAKFSNLNEAMHHKHDKFFASLPSVGYQECLDYQSTSVEGPYFPPESISLGSQYRNSTDNFATKNAQEKRTPGNVGRMGTLAQRHATLEDVMETARSLTDDEIGTVTTCAAPEYCGGKGALKRFYVRGEDMDYELY